MDAASVAAWAAPTAVVSGWVGSALRGLWHRQQAAKARDDRLADVLTKLYSAVVGTDADEFGPARPGLISQVTALAEQVGHIGEMASNNARELVRHESWHQLEDKRSWPNPIPASNGQPTQSPAAKA